MDHQGLLVHTNMFIMKFAGAAAFYTLPLIVGGSPCFVPTPVKRSRISTRQSNLSLQQALKPEVEDSPDDTKSDVRRRGILSLLSATAGGAIVSSTPQDYQALAASSDGLLADLPMTRLRLPAGGIGRDYILVQLTIQGEGPYDFMIDSGLTTEMITPHLQQSLRIGVDGRNKPMVKGLAAGGSTSSQLVQLEGAALCCGKFAKEGARELPLPPLYAVVTDFPQEHLDPQHDPVEGMLGMEMLDLFDCEFDFDAKRFRLWAPGTGAQAAVKAGLVEIPSVVLNESGLLGIRVESVQQQKQPVLGVLDCGASFSALNWKAAEILGLPTDRSAYRNEPAVATLGIDGRPMQMPTKEVAFTFAGESTKTAEGYKFDAPPKSWKPWAPVRVGIADLPIFTQLLGDGVNPYKGPAVLIGLDVLSQRRFIFETGKTRARRMFVAPS